MAKTANRRVANPASLFFCCSVPFTVAAFLQFYQAGNASDFPQSDTASVQRKIFQHKLFGCRPSELGWWSCLLQLIGTLLFILCTYQALNPGPNWISEDIWVWLPNFIGSVLFLLSGYMAFAETCHAYWRCLPRNLSWWAVFWNLAGCIGFCVSGCSCVECRSSHPTAIVDVVHAAGCHQLFIGVHAFDARGCHGPTEISTVTERQPELASPVYRRFSGLASIWKMVTIADNHIRQPVLLM